MADGFSRFCQFPTKEEETPEDLNVDRTDYVMGLLDEFNLPDKYYKLIARCHNSFVGHHGVYRTCKKILEYGYNCIELRRA